MRILHLSVRGGAALSLGLAAASCTQYKRASPETITPATNVRLTFTAPRTVVVVSPSGDSMAVDSVVRIDGRLLAVAADTFLIAISGAEAARALHRAFAVGSTVRVSPGSGRVLYGAFADPRAELAVLVIVGLVVAVILLATLAPDPPPEPEPKPEK